MKSANLQSSDLEDAIVIDDALKELDDTLNFVVQSLNSGDKEGAILALDFMDQSLSDIASLVPSEVYSDMSEIDMESFAEEDLVEIQKITQAMDAKKYEGTKEMIEDMISIKEKGLDLFVVSKNLNDLGVISLDLNVSMSNDEEMQNWTKEEWANAYIGEDPGAMLEAMGGEGFTSDEIVTEKARLALENAKMLGFEIDNKEDVLDFDTDFSALSFDKELGGAEIDINAHTLVGYTKHRAYGQDWTAAQYSDGKTRILADEQELQEAASVFAEEEKGRALTNKIMTNVSKEQATELLQSINEGKQIETVAAQIADTTTSFTSSSKSVTELLTAVEGGDDILKRTLDIIANPEFSHIGRHRMYLQDFDTACYTDGRCELIATPEELAQAAELFEKGEQARDLQNTIRDSMSGEEARLLLKSIKQGDEVPGVVAGLNVEGISSSSEITNLSEQLSESISASTVASVTETAAEVSESVAEVATTVTEVAATVAESVTESIAASIDVEELTKALEEVVGNTTGELTVTSIGRHRGTNAAGQLVDQVAIFRSDGTMEVCKETGDMAAVEARGSCN